MKVPYYSQLKETCFELCTFSRLEVRKRWVRLRGEVWVENLCMPDSLLLPLGYIFVFIWWQNPIGMQQILWGHFFTKLCNIFFLTFFFMLGIGFSHAVGFGCNILYEYPKKQRQGEANSIIFLLLFHFAKYTIPLF